MVFMTKGAPCDKILGSKDIAFKNCSNCLKIVWVLHPKLLHIIEIFSNYNIVEENNSKTFYTIYHKDTF